MDERARYEQKLIRFIERFRANDAHNYGFHNIIRGLFSQPIEGPMFTFWEEKTLTEADKRAVTEEVLKETGFTKAEADKLMPLVEERNAEALAKAKREMEDMRNMKEKLS